MKPKLVPYSVFRDLGKLLVALTNLVEREFPPILVLFSAWALSFLLPRTPQKIL